MHDLLVSYLLGEASPEERSLVERKLRESPELRQHLERLRHCLGLDESASAAATEPPPDLAERTSERVATVADSGEHESMEAAFSSLGFASGASEPGGEAGGATQWSVADLTVATGVVLAVGMLLLPALHDSRCASRRIECQNHLRQLGVALASFSHDNPRRQMPLVQPGEHAGMFALWLFDGGYLNRDTMSPRLVCPSSRLADEIHAGRLEFRIPTIEEFNGSQGPRRVLFLRTTGGSYAYRMGYVEDGELRALPNRYSPHVAVLADSPPSISTVLSDAENAIGNHGGCGQNVLFQDQSVRYHLGYVAPPGEDHLFRNHAGLIAPSDDPADTVLAPSEVRPVILTRDRLSPSQTHRVRIQVVPLSSP